jgi:hypothetical protein
MSCSFFVGSKMIMQLGLIRSWLCCQFLLFPSQP